MKTYGLFLVGLFFLVLISWGVNLSKLTDCDFVAPYKCEVVHALGIVPMFAPVTAWFDSDK